MTATSRKPRSVQTRAFRAGEVIFREGELLGELGLFTGGSPRSATAVAAEPVTLVVILAKQPDYLVRTKPTRAMAIIRDLSAKLRATNLGERRAVPPGPLTS